MARKILVLSVSGHPEREHLKKSVALILVRRLYADWEIPGVSIRRRAIRATRLRSEHGPAIPSRYIPERMPPVDVPGVHFEEPKSATWREQHRMVRFANALAG